MIIAFDKIKGLSLGNTNSSSIIQCALQPSLQNGRTSPSTRSSFWKCSGLTHTFVCFIMNRALNRQQPMSLGWKPVYCTSYLASSKAYRLFPVTTVLQFELILKLEICGKSGLKLKCTLHLEREKRPPQVEKDWVHSHAFMAPLKMQ